MTSGWALTGVSLTHSAVEFAAVLWDRWAQRRWCQARAKGLKCKFRWEEGGCLLAACKENILWSMSSEKRNYVTQTLNCISLFEKLSGKSLNSPPAARSVPGCSPCHWASWLVPSLPKARRPLCLHPGSMAEGEPKMALTQLCWPQLSAALGKEQLKAGRQAASVGSVRGPGSSSTRVVGIKWWQSRKAGKGLLAPLLWMLAHGWYRSIRWLWGSSSETWLDTTETLTVSLWAPPALCVSEPMWYCSWSEDKSVLHLAYSSQAAPVSQSLGLTTTFTGFCFYLPEPTDFHSLLPFAALL